MLALLTILACGSEPPPPPVEAPPPPVDPVAQSLEAIAGHPMKPEEVGPWIGSSTTLEELKERLFAATVVKVEALELTGAWTPEMITALGAAPELGALRTFKAAGVPIGDAGLSALAPRLSNVKVLVLRDAGIGAKGAAALSGLGSLKELDLSGNRIGDAGVKALVGAEALVSLEILHLDGAGLGKASVLALAGAASLDGLKVLSLRDNKLGDDAAQVLAGSPRFADVEALELGGNKLTAAGWAALEDTFPGRVSGKP